MFIKLTSVLIPVLSLLQHLIPGTGGSPIPGPCGSIVIGEKHISSAIARNVAELTLLKKSLQLIGLIAEM